VLLSNLIPELSSAQQKHSIWTKPKIAKKVIEKVQIKFSSHNLLTLNTASDKLLIKTRQLKTCRLHFEHTSFSAQDRFCVRETNRTMKIWWKVNIGTKHLLTLNPFCANHANLGQTLQALSCCSYFTTVACFKVLTFSFISTHVSGSFLPLLSPTQHTSCAWNLESISYKLNLIEGATLSNKWTLSENLKIVYT